MSTPPAWFENAVNYANQTATADRTWMETLWETVDAHYRNAERHELKQLRQAVTIALYALENAMPHDGTPNKS